jgi:tetratricopeptide (TPR) repeat protein
MIRSMNATMQPSLKQGDLERLVGVFRDNPRSMAFLPLAQAYLAAGRPGDAIDVLEQGLAVYPDHAEARLSMARAYVALHRWADAEGELVRVVKLDRYSQAGFALLGEMLARRGNYDVAVKALARACDLDPTDDRSRRALERARIRRPLDPPPPIAGETQPVASAHPRPSLAFGSSAPAILPFEELDEGPTVVSLVPPAGDESLDTQVVVASADPRPDPTREVQEDQVVVSVEIVPVPVAAPPPPRRRRTTFRPRPEPPRDRTPEEYLNEVLGAGAVVARSRDLELDDGLPAEPWGQRVKRPFLWMWLALAAVTLGGAGWYLGDMWARAAAVRRHLDAARAGLIEMSASSLSRAEGEATRAIARDPASVEAVAMLASTRAFALLVYGDGQLIDVETAIVAARQRAKELEAGGQGKRELILARAAFALAAQSRGADVGKELDEARADLDAALASWPEEPLVYWLNGMARQASGDRAGAREALKQAHGLGLTMARVGLADMDLDEGAIDAAIAGYDEALRAAPGHSLAQAGKALARAEAGLEPAAALAEIAPGAEVKVDGKRAEAWHRLAVSRLARRTGDHERARVELDGAVATGTAEARFLARAALALCDDGRFEEAFTARTRLRSRAADLLLPAVDAELLVAGGRPDEALRTLGALEDARARRLRGRALIELGRPADAVPVLTEAAARSPRDVELAAWLALARLAADPREGTAALARLASGSGAPQAVQVIAGEGHLLAGEVDRARRLLEGAQQGNPLAHRAATRLAELALDSGKPADAEAPARAALAAAPGYLPAHAALGRALVGTGRQSEAAPELQLVVDAGRARAVDELAYAEAALASGAPDAARAALVRAKEQGASPEALGRVAALVDPTLAPEVSEPEPKKKGKKARARRR